MASLADKAILSGADNHPRMLEKDMYDSWKSRMELYMLNRQHGKMILESVEHGPLLWPTIEEDGVTRLKKNSEFSAAEAIQADCDVKATNIILQALPLEIYALIDYPVTDTSSLVNHNAYMASNSAPQIDYAPMVQHSSEYSPPETGLMVLVFQKRDDPIDVINHMMSLLTVVVTSRYLATNNQLRTSSNPRQQATINNGWVTIQPIQGRQNSVSAGSSRPFTSGSGGAPGKQRVIVCYNCKGEDCDELNSAKIALMANLSHYGSDNLAEVNNHDNMANYLTHQEMQVPLTFEQSNILTQSNTKNCDELNSGKIALMANLSHYGSDNLAEEIESLKHTLSEHLKEKESLEQKIIILKNDFQTEESRNINRELALEKQEKVLVIIALKEQLNKLKGKPVLTEAVSLNPIDPDLLKVDVAPLFP
nr:hypothetical protein [Tanacetum cinerariifolium]